jgi:hypothetical protein
VEQARQKCRQENMAKVRVNRPPVYICIYPGPI